MEDLRDPLDLVGQNHFEEDFYLGNSEKLICTMKEFHIELHKENITKTSDPLACSNLDIQVGTIPNDRAGSNSAVLYLVGLKLQFP